MRRNYLLRLQCKTAEKEKEWKLHVEFLCHNEEQLFEVRYLRICSKLRVR